jgi:hypothetical protein
VRAWEQVEKPRLRMCLELGPRKHFLYAVLPHSLFAGGIQFDVQEVLEETVPAEANPEALEHHGQGHSA